MIAEIIMDIIRSCVLLATLIGAIQMSRKRKFVPCMVLFALAVASLLLSEIYWLIYDILRPETRMPFAANEVAEWAMFLLLGVSIGAELLLPVHEAYVEIICCILFAAANTALWIGWSGEWAQDILTGMCFAYLLCMIFLRIRREGVLTASREKLLGITCIVLLAGQTATFFVPERIRKMIDLGCYVLLFTIAVMLMAVAVYALFKRTKQEALCCAYIAYAWVVTTMYMSSEGFYIAALAMSACCFPLMLFAWKREVDEA